MFGDLGKGWIELIRFQDYVDDPHYHAPVGGRFGFDRATRGEPLEWWITQLRDNLPQLLEESGFTELVPTVDFEEITANAERLREAMLECIPDTFTFVPGFGVKRIEWSTDQSAFQKRNETEIEVGGLRFEIFFDRDLGSTMEILATRNGTTFPTIRIDDYEEDPHYHAPVGVWFNFDRAALGEPLAWFIDQVRSHLPELLARSGYARFAESLDFAAIAGITDTLYDAMAARVPRGCTRTPGVGLQRV
jgi:hypothetical protein